MKVSSSWRHFATVDFNWITSSANLGMLKKAKYLKNNETPHFATTRESLSLPNLKLKRWYRVTRHMLAIAEFSRNTSHSTSHAEWGIVLLSGGYVSFSPNVWGYTYGTPFTIALDVNEFDQVGGLVSSYLLWVIHCFIVGLQIIIIFIISVLRHSLFHCCLLKCTDGVCSRSESQLTSSPVVILPRSIFFFSICRVCSSFVLSVVFSSQIVRGEVLRSVLISLRLPYFLLTHLLERS